MSLFHRHKWKVTAIRHAEAIMMVGLTPGQPYNGPVTHVLSVCECGAVREEALRGKWTLEELRG